MPIALDRVIAWRKTGLLSSGLVWLCASFVPGADLHAADLYKTEPALGGLSFHEPTQVVFAPGETTRVFVVELAGRVAVVPDLSAPSRSVLLDLTSLLGEDDADQRLVSLAFHPRFAENGYFYLWYLTSVNGLRANRLARYKISADDPNRSDLSSETPLITQLVGDAGHDGGSILFGTDGYLYLSIGDGFNTAEAVDSHQRIDRSFFGGVIRIDVDQRPGNLPPNVHPSVHAGTYLIPADNPFVGATQFNGVAVDPAQVRTEFWATGLRNPFRVTLDEATGQLWCADVGLELSEEINLITKGGNYGWDFREGFAGGPRAGVAPAGFTSVDPIWSYDRSEGQSITGGVLYRGSRFGELRGRYLYADFVSGRVWALLDDGSRPVTASNVKRIATETGIVGFTVDPRNGDILLADWDSHVIKRLIPVEPVSPVSTQLVNLSVRSHAGTADRTLIMGFVIAPAGTKQLLVRGVGPTLAQFGVNNPLPDPRLQLFNSASQPIDQNDNWGGTPALTDAFTSGGASPLAFDSKDAALLLSLGSGVYTAHVTGSGSASGNALVELYDVTPGSAAHLVNASVRSEAGTGDDILILGFVIKGEGAKTLLLRGIGPSLGSQGVAGFLADPRLELFRGPAKIAENDDWNGSNQLKEIFSNVGAFALPSGASKDAVLMVTLQAGVYSVHVSGVNRTTGVALVEIYEVP